MNKNPLKLDEESKIKNIERTKKLLNIFLCIAITIPVIMFISEIIGGKLDSGKIITYAISILLSAMMFFVVYKIE